MAMGIPVITNSGVGDVKNIVERYHAGFVLDDFTEQHLQHVVEQLASNPFFNRDEIRKAAREYYDLDKAVETYARAYSKALT